MYDFEIEAPFSKPIIGNLKLSSCASNRIIVFIHGLYGSFSDNREISKSAEARHLISERGIAHTVQYSSSRNYHTDFYGDRLTQQNAFIGKSFRDEMNDLYSVISHSRRVLEERIGIQQKQIRLSLHGSSLGGPMAILVSKTMDVDQISLCGSGCSANPYSTKPILSTFPPEKVILSAASRYRGDLLLVQGECDDVVPLASGQKILQAATIARRIHYVVPGANHNFTMRDGVDDKSVSYFFVDIIVKFFSQFSDEMSDISA